MEDILEKNYERVKIIGWKKVKTKKSKKKKKGIKKTYIHIKEMKAIMFTRDLK